MISIGFLTKCVSCKTHEYGNNEAPQIENQREDPISSYSCAKVAATYFLQMLHKTENFPVVILRPFLIYGPQQNDKRFIPQVIKGCLEKKEFPTSKGLQIRDFCFIGDFVGSIFSLIDIVIGNDERSIFNDSLISKHYWF